MGFLGVDVDGLQTDDLDGGPVLQEIAWFDDGRRRLVDFFHVWRTVRQKFQLNADGRSD